MTQMKKRRSYKQAAISAGLALFAAVGLCRAQSAAPAANTAVKAETLAVHSEAREASDVVQTLKKGDALVVGAGTEEWTGEMVQRGFSGAEETWIRGVRWVGAD